MSAPENILAVNFIIHQPLNLLLLQSVQRGHRNRKLPAYLFGHKFSQNSLFTPTYFVPKRRRVRPVQREFRAGLFQFGEYGPVSDFGVFLWNGPSVQGKQDYLLHVSNRNAQTPIGRGCGIFSYQWVPHRLFVLERRQVPHRRFLIQKQSAISEMRYRRSGKPGLH